MSVALDSDEGVCRRCRCTHSHSFDAFAFCRTAQPTLAYRRMGYFHLVIAVNRAAPSMPRRCWVDCTNAWAQLRCLLCHDSRSSLQYHFGACMSDWRSCLVHRADSGGACLWAQETL